jgi:hypothetical protein
MLNSWFKEVHPTRRLVVSLTITGLFCSLPAGFHSHHDQASHLNSDICQYKHPETEVQQCSLCLIMTNVSFIERPRTCLFTCNRILLNKPVRHENVHQKHNIFSTGLLRAPPYVSQVCFQS